MRTGVGVMAFCRLTVVHSLAAELRNGISPERVRRIVLGIRMPRRAVEEKCSGVFRNAVIYTALLAFFSRSPSCGAQGEMGRGPAPRRSSAILRQRDSTTEHP